MNKGEGRVVGRTRRVDRLFVFAVAVALLPLAVLCSTVVGGAPPNDFAVAHSSADRWFVASVPVGGPAWTLGVRPGMEIVGIEPGDADPAGRHWDSLLVSDGTVHIGVPSQPLVPSPDAAVVGGVLLGLAAVASLRLPTLGWMLAVGSAVLVGFEVTPLFDPPLNLLLAVFGPLSAALFASDCRRRLHPLTWVAAAFLVGAVGVVWLAAYLAPFDSLQSVQAASVAVTAALVVCGLVGIVQHAWRQARATLEPGHSAADGLAMLADELVPGRARSHVGAIEAERAELATELHAEVLPELSRTIRSLEAGGDQAAIADELRSIAAGLRDLMNERRLAVLDEQGLVAALEWLAERIQEQGRVLVDLDIDGTETTPRPPHDVELTAYRIAQQAVDNALRHAHPMIVDMRVAVGRDHVDLVVGDDGPGIDPAVAARAVRQGHLGLSDMRRRAEAVGGTVFIGPRPGKGTRVEFRWPA